jgi:hypothetical protein
MDQLRHGTRRHTEGLTRGEIIATCEAAGLLTKPN